MMPAYCHPGRIIFLCCLLLAGCAKNAGWSADASRLEKAFGLTFASPPADDPATYKTAAPAALAKTLANALAAGDLDTSAKVLHIFNIRNGGLSFDQYDSVRRVLADVGRELSQRAAHGDPHAKDLLKQMGP